MIKLISRWSLKAGVTKALQQHLISAAKEVESEEAGTLMYLIHLEGPNPLNSSGQPIDPPPDPIPAQEQKYITFIEIYEDAKAFQSHLKGPAFTKFRNESLKYFEENTSKQGWPKSVTYFLEGDTGFTRSYLNKD